MKLKVLEQLPIHKTIYAEDATDKHKLKILQFITHCDPVCVSPPNDPGVCRCILLVLDSSDGKLPVEITRDREDIIAFLAIQQNYVYVRTASNADDTGWLSLHHALHNNSPVGSIHLLVKGSPDTINVADNNGLLPLQYLRDSNDNYLLNYAYRDGNVEVVG
eukprot:scaffold83139_cov27-Cyclotella_meneghiniana.AAC.2